MHFCPKIRRRCCQSLEIGTKSTKERRRWASIGGCIVSCIPSIKMLVLQNWRGISSATLSLLQTRRQQRSFSTVVTLQPRLCGPRPPPLQFPNARSAIHPAKVLHHRRRSQRPLLCRRRRRRLRLLACRVCHSHNLKLERKQDITNIFLCNTRGTFCAMATWRSISCRIASRR